MTWVALIGGRWGFDMAADIPFISLQVPPTTSLEALRTGASAGNMAADNRLRAASLAQREMESSQELALRRMAVEAERQQHAESLQFKREALQEELSFKAAEAAGDWQNRLDVTRLTADARREMGELRGDYQMELLKTKLSFGEQMKEAQRQHALAQLEGTEGADVNLVLDPKRKTAAEKQLLSIKMKEAGATQALDRMRAMPGVLNEDVRKVEQEVTTLKAQREFLERSLGRVKRGVPGDRPFTVLPEDFPKSPAFTTGENPLGATTPGAGGRALPVIPLYQGGKLQR